LKSNFPGKNQLLLKKRTNRTINLEFRIRYRRRSLDEHPISFNHIREK